MFTTFCGSPVINVVTEGLVVLPARLKFKIELVGLKNEIGMDGREEILVKIIVPFARATV